MATVRTCLINDRGTAMTFENANERYVQLRAWWCMAHICVT